MTVSVIKVPRSLEKFGIYILFELNFFQLDEELNYVSKNYVTTISGIYKTSNFIKIN